MAKKRIPINYDAIIESNVLIQKDNETVNVKFLDNGFMEEYQLSKDNIIPKYIYTVEDLDDNNKVKEWSILSNRGILKIKELQPIEGRSFQILKDAFGDEVYDKDYHFTEITRKTPTKK